MQTLFPKARDEFNLPRTADERNAGERSTQLGQRDLPYLLDALQKKVGTDNSGDSSRHDYRISQIETAIVILSLSAAGNKTVYAVLAAGDNVVSLATPMTTDYSVFGQFITSDGLIGTFGISAQSSTGFTVTSDSIGTFQCVLIPR